MLHIEGYIHSDRLAEVIGRWMVNQAEPGVNYRGIVGWINPQIG